MSGLPRVALISTGGTIDAVGASRLDLAWYTETKDRLPDGGLLAALPELGTVADVVQIPFVRMPSYALSTTDWSLLAATVQELAAGGSYEGIVVTHGTNTLEETAFLLSLTVSTAIPIVLVGAMRPANGLGSDGTINLFQAVRLAASARARGQGVLVMLSDTVFAARDATKASTFRVNAFTAPGLGPLGYVDADGEIRLSHIHATNAIPAFDIGDIARMPRVDVVLSYVGADGAMIEAAVAAGAQGIVSAGTGAGRPTPAESDALDAAAAQGVVVCQSTRVQSGRVSRSPAMKAARRVTAPAMAPWQARIALALAVQRTDDIDEIQITLDAL
nr:asparaginase [Arthrobacter sp. IN13]